MEDVLLTIAICFTQLVLGFMGVYVSLRQPRKERHKFWIAAFLIIGLSGVCFTAWLAARAAKAQDGLQKQLARAHIHISIGSYSVDDPTNLPQKWRPFMEGQEASFRVSYANTGNGNSENTGAAGELILTEKRPDLDAAFSNLGHMFPNGWHGDELVHEDGEFFNAKSHSISKEESAKIASGAMGVFLITAIRFSDSTGNYQQEFCEWLQPRTLDVWHGCGVHEKEIKLK